MHLTGQFPMVFSIMGALVMAAALFVSARPPSSRRLRPIRVRVRADAAERRVDRR